MARRTFIDTANAARLLPKVEGLDLGAGDVPVFSTLAAAEAWEAKNPGRKALTLEPSTPDTTAPTWNATLTVGTPTDTTVVVTASALATDDRTVAYEVTYNGSAASPAWMPIVPSGKNFTLSGSAGQTYTATKLRAVDAAGNTSTALSVPSYTLDAAPPHPYITAAKALSLQHIYALDGTAQSVTNQGTAATPTPRLASMSYGAGVGGFAQSATAGTVFLDNYLPAGIPAYTIAAIWKTPADISAYKVPFRVWENKNRVQAASAVPWRADGPTVGGNMGTAKAAASTVYHVALTWDGATLALYVDGVLQGTLADPGPVASTTALAFFPLESLGMSGIIADATKALTAAQVKQLSDAVAR